MGEISTYFASPNARSLVLPGVPVDHTYTVSVRAYRTVDGDINATGRIVSSSVATAPYRPADFPAFRGDILGTIQGRDSLLVVTNLEAISSDSVLSTTEKPGLILSYNQAISQWTALDAKAASIGGFTTQRDAALAAKNALVTYLTGLSPAWNDASVHTPIGASTFQSRWASFYSALADLDAAITGRQGDPGTAGLNNATLFIYKRSATAPALPTASVTYTFATAALTGLTNGWTTTPPTGSDPLYVAVATASSTTATDTVANTEWATPVILALNGAAGLNVATVFLYKRSATAPAKPTTTTTFTFATGVATGQDGGWTQTVPGGTDPLYVITGSAAATGTTDTIAGTEWSAPTIMATNGSNGLNNATVFVYKRSATLPAVPSASTTYTFSTGALAGLNNGWTQAVPAGTTPLYVAVATASSAGTTDTIATGEWAAPVILAQDGSAGLNVATAYLYKRSATAPAVPTTTSTFTFATGVLAGHDGGWTQTIPGGTDPLYVITGTASSNGATDTIASTEWAAPSILAANGATGPGGPVIALTSNAQGFRFVDNAIETVGQTITVSAIRQNTSEAVTFSASPAVTLGTTADAMERTLTIENLGTNRQVVITVVGNITGVKDTITLMRLDRSTAEAGATVGAAWDTNLDGVPDNLQGLAGNESILNSEVTIEGIAPGLVSVATDASNCAVDVADNNKFSRVEKQRWVEKVREWTTIIPDNVNQLNAMGFGTLATALTAAWSGTSGLLPYLEENSYYNLSRSDTISRSTLTTRANALAAALTNAANARHAAVTMVGDANRVRFSLMEAGKAGWGMWNPSNLTRAADPANVFYAGTYLGKNFIRALGEFTANSQTISLHSTTASGLRIPVTGGERLSVSAGLEIQCAAGASWSFLIQFFDAAGTFISNVNIGSGSGGVAYNTRYSAFATAPTNAVSAYLECYVSSLTSGAGVFGALIIEPMVCGAGVSQTTHPSFSPGPSAERGATVGATIGVDTRAANGTVLGAADLQNDRLSLIEDNESNFQRLRLSRDGIVYGGVRTNTEYGATYGADVGINTFDRNGNPLVERDMLNSEIGADYGINAQGRVHIRTYRGPAGNRAYMSDLDIGVEAGATYGADVGVNTFNSAGQLLGEAQLLNSQVPLGQNAIVNSNFSHSGEFTYGWTPSWNGNHPGAPTINRGVNLDANWSGQMNVAYAYLSGASQAGYAFDGYEHLPVTETTTLLNLQRWAMPVVAGERVFFSALLGVHRCTAAVLCVWYNGVGDIIGENYSNQGGRAGGGSGGNPDQFDRLAGFAIAPAGTRYAVIRIRAYTQTSDNPYIFFTQAMLCKVPADQTIWPAYNTGPADRSSNFVANVAPGGTHRMMIPGSGVRVGDARNLPAITGVGMRFKFTGAITYESNWNAAGGYAISTVTVGAGYSYVGSATINYNAMTWTMGGTGTDLIYLYVDDPSYAGGSQTLQGTTSDLVPYQNDGRVFIGTVQIVHATAANPDPPPGDGEGGTGNCVAADSWVQTGRGLVRARDVIAGDYLLILTEDRTGTEWVECEGSITVPENAVRLTTASGYQLDCSLCTPITLRDGSCVEAAECDGVEVPILVDDEVRWEAVRTEFIGMQLVQRISCHSQVYAAGKRPDQLIFTHNFRTLPKP